MSKDWLVGQKYNMWKDAIIGHVRGKDLLSLNASLQTEEIYSREITYTSKDYAGIIQRKASEKNHN